MIKVSPSLLSADFLNLNAEIKLIEESNADSIHIDVMDGHFVPSLTYGPLIIQQIRKITALPLEVHLMVANAEQTFHEYIDAGADTIFVHSEACIHLDRLVSAIKARDVKVGIALNPATSESVLEYLYHAIDTVLVMTVNPGFGAQPFLESQLEKIISIRRRIVELESNIVIAVDGGIDNRTAELVVSSGAGVLVAGSYLFSDRKSFSEKVMFLRSLP